MTAVTLTITVTGDPSEEDEGVPGTYEASVPSEAYERSKADACDLALDAFHGKVGIAELDDFTITVTGPDGDVLVGNDEWNGEGVRATYDGKVS